jgi:hypothetical protein
VRIRTTLLELIAVRNRERMALRISATHKSVGSCRPLTRSVAGQMEVISSLTLPRHLQPRARTKNHSGRIAKFQRLALARMAEAVEHRAHEGMAYRLGYLG